MKHECNKEREIDSIYKNLREIRVDIKTLIEKTAENRIKSSLLYSLPSLAIGVVTILSVYYMVKA